MGWCGCGGGSTLMRNVSTLRYAAIVAAVLASLASAETVYEALGRHSDLHKFHEMVNRDEVLRKLLQNWPVTVFAPTDEAVDENKEWVLGRENKVVSYHVLNLVANISLFPFTSVTSLAGAPPLYLGVREIPGQENGKEYFVNNAKILRTENYVSLEGNQQILYVIDEILQPYMSSSSLPPNAYELLMKPELYGIREPLSAFSFRVKQEGLQELFQREGNHTYFVPIGAEVGHSFNRQQKVDKWVIRGHVIPKHVLFTRLAGSDKYRSETFGEDVKVELSVVNESKAVGNPILYAQSYTIHSDFGHKKGAMLSKIVKPNIPVKNGVVHLIEGPLMIIDIKVWKYLNEEREEDRFSEFLYLVAYAPDFKDLLMSPQEKTLFAPSNEAIQQIPQDTLNQMKTNITSITNLLKLHLVMKSISTDDVMYGRHREYLSADNRNSLYFRVIGNENNRTLTVDGGGVKAAAIQSDIGAVDGMIHVIDRLLGLPYQTLYRKLQTDADLSITYNMSELDEWSRELDNHQQRFTFFAPSNEAWEYLRRQMPTEYKQLTMGAFAYHVHKILDRHLIVGKEYHFDDINQMSQLQMRHGHFKIKPVSEEGIHSSRAHGFRTNVTQTIKPKGDKILFWEGEQARIVRPDVQAVNGVIHIIDRVMMKRRDLTKSSAQPGPTAHLPMWTLTFFSFCSWMCL